MKLIKSTMFWMMTTIICLIGYGVGCTKSNQVVVSGVTTVSSNTLISMKVTSAPTIDGVVDPMWASASKIEFSPAVPEVTGDVFRGYTGNIIPSVTLQSAYDATNIYFLIEWTDPTESLSREPWYFNPTTKTWAQELGTFEFGPTGSILRAPFYEDKLAFLWNINNSVAGWNNATCYKSCHTGLPATDGSSRHFTNYVTEKIDMWHWKSVRGGVNGGFQLNDQYQSNIYPNGRKSDPGTDAPTNNTQKLVVTGSNPAVTISVPKYVIPARTNYKWILASEITAGTAKTVTAVDAAGVLTLNDGTTIDPNVGTDYQRVGAGLGAKVIPGLSISSYTGSAGDISCKSTYTGKGWILEITRALKTADAVYDVDFSSLEDQYFGFAIFENAQIAHAIQPNLLMKFQK